MDKTSLLAMYDVRGIQNYIFKTNKVREIIGASELVENIILNGLNYVIKSNNWDKTIYLTDWENDDAEAFLNNDNIRMQVLFIGGGNAYVLFRDAEICQKVNRALGKYVLENTYSLNLAVSVVNKTDDYSKDYKNINLKMMDIKSKMPKSMPMGAFPFMDTDHSTGYPLSKYDHATKDYISTESELKRKHVVAEDEVAKILDNMVTQKGDNSFLAVVHIDGNSMGNRIKGIMEGKTEYVDAIRTMRIISKTLKNEFNCCYENMCKKIDEEFGEANSKKAMYRKIIVAGDDITFICNAKIAVFAVTEFLKLVAERNMYADDKLTDEDNRKKYAMSACAGIAFFKSHFPFSDAYEVAEACCSNAKKQAKKAENRHDGKTDGMIGCYLDYQLCTHIKATDLEEYRYRNYAMADGKSMIYRPYYVSSTSYDGLFDINERNRNWDIEKVLWENIKVFSDDEESRSKYKKLRNTFSFGLNKVDEEVVFLNSRKTKLPDTPKGSWYDALEIVDICELGGKR